MKYSIEPIEKHQARDWERLRAALWEDEDHWTEIQKFFNGELEEPEAVLVATDTSGKIVAHVELSIRYDIEQTAGAKTGYIEGLYVEPEHRGSGLVMQLLRASEAWAAQNGCLAFASDRDERVIVYEDFQSPAV